MKTILIARIIGIWQTMHAAGWIKKWGAFALACALIAAVSLSTWLILPFGSEAAWIGLPLLASSVLAAWALFWPMNCATWFGWIGMLFRLVGVLALSNVIWMIVAVVR